MDGEAFGDEAMKSKTDNLQTTGMSRAKTIGEKQCTSCTDVADSVVSPSLTLINADPVAADPRLRLLRPLSREPLARMKAVARVARLTRSAMPRLSRSDKARSRCRETDKTHRGGRE